MSAFVVVYMLYWRRIFNGEGQSSCSLGTVKENGRRYGLYLCAANLIQAVETCLTPGDYPLWVAQTQCINCWYAAWAGDMKLLEWAFERRASIATVIPLSP